MRSFCSGFLITITSLIVVASSSQLSLAQAASTSISTVQSDDNGVYQYSIDNCILTASTVYRTFDPDRQLLTCNRADELSAEFTTDLRKIDHMELYYPKTSFSGPTLFVTCSANDCATKTKSYSNNCNQEKIDNQLKGERVGIQFSNTPTSNSMFRPLVRDVKMAAKRCSPKLTYKESLDLPLEVSGTPDSRECEKFKPGRVVQFQPAGYVYFGNKIDAVVMTTNDDKVTIRMLKSAYTSLNDRVLAMSCKSDQLFLK